MTKNRMEAFSDGVLTIIITIMVLELKVPHGTDLSALKPLIPVFLSYVLSFVHVGIYWNNHHHLIHIARHIDGRVLWANMHLLFWLSLFPFGTAWMGENVFSIWTVVMYGFILIMAAVSYFLLVQTLLRAKGGNHELAAALGRGIKEKISLSLYATGIGLAFIHPWLGCALYGVVAMIWLIPDRRIEKIFQNG